MKIHMIFNTKGEIIRLMITPGNVNDRKPVPSMVKDLTATLIGDKGYLSKSSFKSFLKQGLLLLPKSRKI